MLSITPKYLAAHERMENVVILLTVAIGWATVGTPSGQGTADSVEETGKAAVARHQLCEIEDPPPISLTMKLLQC